MDSLNVQYCKPPTEKQLGFLIGWGDIMGARIGGNDLSPAYTST